MNTRKDMKLEAKKSLKGNWGVSIALVFVLIAICGALEWVLTYYSDRMYIGVLSIVISLITIPLVLGKTIYFLKLTKGEDSKFQDLFSGFNNILKVIGVAILSDVIIIIGYILLIIPGIIFTFMLSQVYYILAENPEIGIIECLKESKRLMEGKKIDYFVLMLSFILWGILTGLTLGLAGLYVIPYYEATIANFYLSIKSQKSKDILIGY